MVFIQLIFGHHCDRNQLIKTKKSPNNLRKKLLTSTSLTVMDLVWVKVITMVLTGVIPILLSLLPFCFKSYVQRSDSKKKASFALSGTLTSCLLCFGAGVLLATSFVHILAEVSG